MCLRSFSTRIFILIIFAGSAFTGDIQMEPFAMDWRDNSDSLVNMFFLLDAPAGKDGFRICSFFWMHRQAKTDLSA